jgi:hypothetical protein
MKRSVLFSVAVVLGSVICAQASITLLQDDRVTLNGQISGNSAGYGGAFDWQVALLAHPLAEYGSTPPTVGDHFNTFCVELTQHVSPGSTYKVRDNPFTPTVNGAANTTGKVWNDLKGVFLFEKWSSGVLTWSNHSTSQIAGAVQAAIWMSEGYNSTQISNYGGLTASTYTTQITNWLTALGYTSAWTPSSTKLINLTTLSNLEVQDQIALVSIPQVGGYDVPEPASIVIWLVFGLSVSAVAVVRRRLA